MVLHEVADTLSKAGLICCRGLATHTIVLVLCNGHYRVLIARSADGKRLGCFSCFDDIQEAVRLRGGMDFCTPERRVSCNDDDWLRTCSSIGKRGNGKQHSGGKFSMGSPSCCKKATKQVAKHKVWRCDVCGCEIEGTFHSIRGKIRYHLKKLHGEVFEKFKGQCKEKGGFFNGLSWRQQVMPVPFRSLRQPKFKCPWCGLGLPHGCVGAPLKKSKEEHLKSCVSRPAVLPSLWQFHHMGRSAAKNDGKIVIPSVCPLKGGVKFFQLGHKVQLVRFGKVSGIKYRRSGWICTLCGASSIGTHSSLQRQCVGWLKFDSLRFWNCLKESGQLEEFLQNQLQDLVTRARGMIEQDVDFGHDFVKVPLHLQRSKLIKSSWWCRRCNVASITGSDWYRRDCQGHLVCRSVSFWKALKSMGKHHEVLQQAQMSEDDLLQLRSWVLGEEDRGHDLVRVFVGSEKPKVKFALVCKCCNACNYGSLINFRKVCSKSICTQSYSFWWLVWQKGALEETLALVSTELAEFVKQMIASSAAE